MSIAFLKIKVKSLAAEATIIRHEEKLYLDRRPGSFWYQLNYHRIVDVRKEARAAHLAYNFLRGNAYREVEATYHDEPDWKRVSELVKKFGPPSPALEIRQKLEAWKRVGHNSAQHL